MTDIVTLGELLESILTIDDESIIFVDDSSPLGASSRAILVPEDDEEEALGGMRYLLEVSLAREVIDVWSGWRNGVMPSVSQKCEAVIYYTENDAYIPVD